MAVSVVNFAVWQCNIITFQNSNYSHKYKMTMAERTEFNKMKLAVIRFVIPVVFIVKLNCSLCICLTQLYAGRDMYRIYYIKTPTCGWFLVAVFTLLLSYRACIKWLLICGEYVTSSNRLVHQPSHKKSHLRLHLHASFRYSRETTRPKLLNHTPRNTTTIRPSQL